MAERISFLEWILILFFKALNVIVEWHKLPRFVGIFNLLAYRIELNSQNLHDTYPETDKIGAKEACPMTDSRYLTTRNSDGLFNDLEQPLMGCAGRRFGRNVKRTLTKRPTDEEILTPNPRIVADTLLKRETFKPATIVNLLAAAWIQFQVHDWAVHESYLPGQEDFEVPLPGAPHKEWPSKTMKLPRDKPAPPLSKIDNVAPAYRNIETAWWDASQIYGSSEAETMELRRGAVNGKLAMKGSGTDATENFLPRDQNNLPKTGFNMNWWLGLELLHTLFAKEHNSICDMLIRNNPELAAQEQSDRVFDIARIINCALLAKIHTVEWTPAILKHPTLEIAMNTNWWGLLGEKLNKIIGRVGKGDILSGIPGSGVDHHGAPYALTEEFVSVYRLHPLIPDDIAFFKASTGEHTKTLPMRDVAFEKAQDAMTDNCTFADALYSFGVNHPGAITHHNYPDFLRNVTPTDAVQRDMACVDLVRDRERGVPRYCEFRRQFHMRAPRTFDELVGVGAQGGDPSLARQLEDVYSGDVEKVDLMVGMFCEPLPEGFGFSDTAFRVFILMASRRIKSDRFLAGDAWGPEAYTHGGIDWVQNETMKSILCRHFPQLAPALLGVDNAFRPWNKVGATARYVGREMGAVHGTATGASAATGAAIRSARQRTKKN